MTDKDSLLEAKEILDKIIENNGSCSWVDISSKTCENCPIGKLLIDENGNQMSCLEAVLTDENTRFVTPEKQNQIFKNKAMDTLATIMIEESLGDISGHDDK